jgi:hypothetical protein
MSSYPSSWDQLAHQHGFDSFDQWVRFAETKLAEEELHKMGEQTAYTKEASDD